MNCQKVQLLVMLSGNYAEEMSMSVVYDLTNHKNLDDSYFNDCIYEHQKYNDNMEGTEELTKLANEELEKFDDDYSAVKSAEGVLADGIYYVEAF